MRFIRFTILLSCLTLAFMLQAETAAQSADECATTGRCSFDGENGGSYHVDPKFFDKPDATLRPFIFFHGHRGSGSGVMRNKALARNLREKGYVLIAPDGPLFRLREKPVRGWAARHEEGTPRGNRDDIAFVERVIADIRDRFKLDVSKTVVSGFSSGGSMAWYFSCFSQMPLGGVVAVAGGLRRPIPGGAKGGEGRFDAKCPGGPRKLIHIHGFSDGQVPLEGRAIRVWHQGDVFEGLAVQRQTNFCVSKPTKFDVDDQFWCRSWTACESGQAIKLCLHSGGHGLPKNWLQLGLDWMEKQK